jgi:hypothetical protein
VALLYVVAHTAAGRQVLPGAARPFGMECSGVFAAFGPFLLRLGSCCVKFCGFESNRLSSLQCCFVCLLFVFLSIVMYSG